MSTVIMLFVFIIAFAVLIYFDRREEANKRKDMADKVRAENEKFERDHRLRPKKPI